MITVRAIVPDVVNTAGQGVLMPASPDEIVQWLNGLKPDGLTLNDKSEVVTEPTLVQVDCLLFAGGVGQIVDSDIQVGDTVTSSGTAAGTAGDGVIDFSDGTATWITVSRGGEIIAQYGACEATGTTLNRSEYIAPEPPQNKINYTDTINYADTLNFYV